MALPRRHRVRITVDGQAFHWTRGAKSAENGWVTVQSATGRGQLLRIDLAAIPLPADIADAIRFGKTHGWIPELSGPPTFIGFAKEADRPRFVVRAQSSPNYALELSMRNPGVK